MDTCLEKNRLQGIISFTESDEYLRIQRIINPLFQEFDDEYPDYMTDVEWNSLEEAVYELSSDIRSSFDRMHRMSSDNAVMEEWYETGRVDAGMAFLEALEGASTEVDKSVRVTVELVNG